MLTADEARKIANRHRSEIDSVLDYIKLRAEQGYFNGVFWFASLSVDKTIGQLKELGYIIEKTKLRYKGEMIYKIKW